MNTNLAGAERELIEKYGRAARIQEEMAGERRLETRTSLTSIE